MSERQKVFGVDILCFKIIFAVLLVKIPSLQSYETARLGIIIDILIKLRRKGHRLLTSMLPLVQLLVNTKLSSAEMHCGNKMRKCLVSVLSELGSCFNVISMLKH